VKKKARTFFYFRLGPNTTAVAVDDPLYDGKAHTGTLVVSGAVQTLKDAKELVDVTHVKADTVVFDEIGTFTWVLAVDLVPVADLDQRYIPSAGILERIFEQVKKHLLEQGRVALARGKLADRYLHVPTFLFVAQVVEYLLHKKFRSN